MGGCESVCAADRNIDGAHDKYTCDMDKAIAQEKENEKNHFKILLLGAGESGKSTIIKQLSLLYRRNGITEDRRQFIRVLQTNTITCMTSLIKAARQFDYDSKQTTDWKTDASEVEAASDGAGGDGMTEDLAACIERLWKSECIQKAYMRRNEFWILETAHYYFENCRRFVEDGFMPNDEDVIMARKRTTGVIVTDFVHEGIKFSVVDVGGQRSERRKWFNCFEDVKAILWVSNLAGYDKVLFEDKSINRMHEDLSIFRDTIKSPAFKNVQIFLFLNKKDLFDESIKSVNIDECFPDYDGEQDTEKCQEFIAGKFREEMPMGKKFMGVYFLSAKHKNEVQSAFEKVKKVLVDINNSNLSQSSSPSSSSSSSSSSNHSSSSNSSLKSLKQSSSTSKGRSKRGTLDKED